MRFVLRAVNSSFQRPPPSSSLPTPGFSAEDYVNSVNLILRTLVNVQKEVRKGSGYLARQEIERLKGEIRGDPKRLEPYGYKVYSQTDEDGMLAEIFRRIGVDKGGFCEIGVENGLECNTLYLLHRGWRGVWLEGNPQQQQAIESKFHTLIGSRRLALQMGMVTPDNINEVLGSALLSLGLEVGSLDFLSIDIDGMDIYLLEALACRPKVICIEYNSKFPPPVSKKPIYDAHYSWSGTDYMGSSLTALSESADAKGYSLVGTNLAGANAFFVRRDLIGDKFPALLTPEALYNPPRYVLWQDHYLDFGHPADFGPYVDLG